MHHDLAAVASVVGEPARAAMLAAMMDGTAYTAGELARVAGVAPSTASFHLGRLTDARLVVPLVQGRHRYYRVTGEDVADLLEALARHAPAVRPRSLSHATMVEAMRRARLCYSHLAGRLGVALHDALVRDGSLIDDGAGYRWTERLRTHARDLDAPLPAGRDADRRIARPCLDCSERRFHLAGAFASGVARTLFARLWLVRTERTRVVRVTSRGFDELGARFGIDARTLAGEADSRATGTTLADAVEARR